MCLLVSREITRCGILLATFGACVFGALLILLHHSGGVDHMLALGAAVANEEGFVGVGDRFVGAIAGCRRL